MYKYSCWLKTNKEPLTIKDEAIFEQLSQNKIVYNKKSLFNYSIVITTDEQNKNIGATYTISLNKSKESPTLFKLVEKEKNKNSILTLISLLNDCFDSKNVIISYFTAETIEELKANSLIIRLMNDNIKKGKK